MTFANMKYMYYLLSLLVVCLFGLSDMYAQQPIDYVNMRIGTDGEHRTEYGGTVPAVTTPFGMTQWCPVTRINGISRTMYHNKDSLLLGFMATHQPAVWMGDYGYMTLMPQCGSLKLKPSERGVRLDRTQEVLTPYYYKVTTSEGGEQQQIATELTATSRASFFRFRYPKQEKALLYLEAGRGKRGGGIEIFPEKREIHIYNEDRHDAHLGPETPDLRGYYVLKFSADLADYGVWKDSLVTAGKTQEAGTSAGGYVAFPAGTEMMELRIGSSFISFEQAGENLAKEIQKTASFGQTVKKVRTAWNRSLSKIKLKGGTEDDRVVFYTAFFHTLQYPREFSEYGRYYSPFDGKVHEGVSYNAYSLWDTFRAEHPWLQLVASERVDDMITSLVQMYEEGGWIPKWPNPTYTNIMIGTHADAVIADAYVNGFRNYDVEQAYKAIHKDAYVPPLYDDKSKWGDRALWNGQYEARGGLTNYLHKGYVASDCTYESVARTLEFALDDYCIAQMAKGLGHTDDYVDLMKRAANYKHLYNSELKFFQARKADGTWDQAHVGFTEGANWTYRFCVMQDVPGMIDLMGGSDAFMQLLDRNFDEKHYRHDNEPGHHYAYLYNYCNRLDKTQSRLRTILKDNYKNAPDGLSSNDDCGQMSAWYLFSALGFYPVTPASGMYALGIPHFEEIRLQLPNKRVLKIRAKGLESYHTLDDVRLNGKALDSPFVKISDLLEGGVLEFCPKR